MLSKFWVKYITQPLVVNSTKKINFLGKYIHPPKKFFKTCHTSFNKGPSINDVTPKIGLCYPPPSLCHPMSPLTLLPLKRGDVTPIPEPLPFKLKSINRKVPQFFHNSVLTLKEAQCNNIFVNQNIDFIGLF